MHRWCIVALLESSGCIVQGQAICDRFCRREWSWQEHKSGQDRLLAGPKQDDGMQHGVLQLLERAAVLVCFVPEDVHNITYCQLPSSFCTAEQALACFVVCLVPSILCVGQAHAVKSMYRTDDKQAMS